MLVSSNMGVGAGRKQNNIGLIRAFLANGIGAIEKMVELCL